MFQRSKNISGQADTHADITSPGRVNFTAVSGYDAKGKHEVSHGGPQGQRGT